MQRPNLIDRIIVSITHIALDYIHVDHPSPLWVRKGQALILLQTLLMIVAWANFASYIFAEYRTLFPTIEANMAYWVLTLFLLATMIVPIRLAQRGRVKLAAYFMLIPQVIGLFKYALARGFPQYNILTMAALMVMIPLAGTLLRPRASLFMAMIITALEWVATALFDPTLPPFVLPSITWLNLNLGVVTMVILIIYERTLAEQEPHIVALPTDQEDLEWVGWNVARRAHQQMRQPLEAMRARLLHLEQAERPLSAAARSELHTMQMEIHDLLQDWSRVLDVYPSGVMAVELESYRLPSNWVLDRMQITEGPIRVQVCHDPGLPGQVMCAPVAMRRALDELVGYVATLTGAREITIADSLIDDCWTIRVSGESTLRSGAPVDPMHPRLRWAAARIEAMQGTLAVQAAPGAPVVLTVSLPVPAPEPIA